MKKLLSVGALILGAALSSPIPSPAGQNAGAIAHVYWQAFPRGRGLESPCSYSAVTSFIITVKGVSSFRGADVQLMMASRSGLVPAAWQFQAGGCAEGAASFQPGGWGGHYRNIFTTPPAMAGTQLAHNEMTFNNGSCETAHGTGFFHLSATAPTAVTRDPNIEYAVWGVAVDLTATDPSTGDPCEGGAADPLGPVSVFISPRLQIPCNGLREQAMTVLDADSATDMAFYPTLPKQIYSLGWMDAPGINCDNCPDYYFMGCGFTPVPKKTWGWLRRVYR